SPDGPSPRTLATTRRAIPSRPPTRGTAGPTAAGDRLSFLTARSSSVTYSGLPPLAVQTALQNSSPAWSPTVARTTSRTALSLNNAGETTAVASIRRDASDALVEASSPGRSATSTEIDNPSSRDTR